MTLKIKENKPFEKIKLDLTGEDGNVFAVIGLGRKISNKIGIDFKPIQKDMMSSDYGHAIRVFEKHFGDFVDIEMDNSTMIQVNPFHNF